MEHTPIQSAENGVLNAPPGELVQLRRSKHIDRPMDNTALKDYMACPRRYFYGMVMNRRRKGPPAVALSYGAALHKGLEEWYLTGDVGRAQGAIVKHWEQHDRPDDHRTIQRCMTQIESYARKYGTPDEEAKVWGRTVGYPENPLIEIPVELTWDGALHPYTGRLDRLVEWQGMIYVEDHKTTSAVDVATSGSYFKQFDPDNQMMGYVWLARVLTRLPIVGVRINAISVLKSKDSFARQPVSFSEDRMENWAKNYNTWIMKIEMAYANTPPEARDPETLREEDIADIWPHNFTACYGKYNNACPYVPVCTMNPRRRGQVLAQDYAFNPWDPMATFLEGEDA